MANSLTFDLPYGKSCIMNLATYLESQKIKPAQFAALIGVPASTISRILRGDREPRLSTAQKISQATGGKVSLSDLVPSTLAEAS